MIGKLIGAYIGEKIMARSGRAGSGAIAGAAGATLARRGIKPLAVVLVAGYGIKMLRDHRRTRRRAA